MKQLNFEEVQNVSGGCEEHCWGDFETGALLASMAGGAVGGALGGPQGAAIGALGGAIGYMFELMWTD